jgi:peptidoglycan/xylan/chitin deacetylase (PgdA/CDA1 family)
LYSAFPTGLLEELRARYRSFAPMTWAQARQLKSAGVDVGSHSLTHTALGPQSPEAVRHEVFAARELLQARIGDHSLHFSYPYGRLASLSEQTEATLFEAGYNCALTLEQDVVRCDEVNLLQLPRLIVSPLVGRMVFNLWQRFLR